MRQRRSAIRLPPRTAVCLGVICLWAVSGCSGDSASDREAAAPDPTAASPQDETGQQSPPGKPAPSELALEPDNARPGQKVRIVVLNREDTELEYGLGGLILQRHRPSGEWTTIAGNLDRVRRVRLVVAPGDTAGPSYAGAVDQIRVPRDIRPGVYRVAKRVRGAGANVAVLTARLRINPV